VFCCQQRPKGRIGSHEVSYVEYLGSVPRDHPSGAFEPMNVVHACCKIFFVARGCSGGGGVVVGLFFPLQVNASGGR